MLSSFLLAEEKLPYLLHRFLAYHAPAVRATTAATAMIAVPVRYCARPAGCPQLSSAPTWRRGRRGRWWWGRRRRRDRARSRRRSLRGLRASEGEHSLRIVQRGKGADLRPVKEPVRPSLSLGVEVVGSHHSAFTASGESLASVGAVSAVPDRYGPLARVRTIVHRVILSLGGTLPQRPGKGQQAQGKHTCQRQERKFPHRVVHREPPEQELVHPILPAGRQASICWRQS
jgi:hypothetical protein